jgi:signal transduction histidine kinase
MAGINSCVPQVAEEPEADAERRRLMSELRMSRERLVAAGDAERQRLERDLHDGAQQRLTALSVRIGIAAATYEERGETEFSELLADLSGELDAAIEDVRVIAHGLYPPLLSAYGLGKALNAAATRTMGHVTIDTHGLGRYPSEVERAVYFSCLASIQNAAKHAKSTTIAVRVREQAHHELHFSVTDDGVGFDPAQINAGMGLTNIRERVSAAGGVVTIDSAPSHGTRVAGLVPFATD